MDPFVQIKRIRLKETHPGKGVYIALNGKQIEEPMLSGNIPDESESE